MKQIIQLDNILKQRIIYLESKCEMISKSLCEKYSDQFKNNGELLIIEMMRTKKGKRCNGADQFNVDYESFVEIGIEKDDEYFPNCHLPLWKCKEEWFQKTGYLTNKEPNEISFMIESMIKDMLEECEHIQGERDKL